MSKNIYYYHYAARHLPLSANPSNITSIMFISPCRQWGHLAHPVASCVYLSGCRLWITGQRNCLRGTKFKSRSRGQSIKSRLTFRAHGWHYKTRHDLPSQMDVKEYMAFFQNKSREFSLVSWLMFILQPTSLK